MGIVRLKLKEYLKQRGLSRYYLSKKVNSRYNTIDDYFKDKVERYDSDLLARICDALECDICDIIEYVKDVD